MSCYCTECATIRETRDSIDKIDFVKLCSSKQPEDFAVAMHLATASKSLEEAQEILSEKHLGGGGGGAESSSSGRDGDTSSSVTPRPYFDPEGSPFVARDNALVLHEKRNSSNFDNSKAPADGEHSPSIDGRALVVRSKKPAAGQENRPPVVKQIGPRAYEGNPSPQHGRSVSTTSQKTNPWEGIDPSSPVAEGFSKVVRNRAAELGILRGVDSGNDAVIHNPNPTSVTSIHDAKDPVKEKTRFIVCDHCRAHGLRCNEASVCTECILRELPCTHRQCDLSPSKELCPRQICFYVHPDWMPDIYGRHNPDDPLWIILPGKIRDHLSAGALSKMVKPCEEEVMRCYRGVNERQRQAVVDMSECVKKGNRNLDSVFMACGCVEIEYENKRAAQAEENIRRMQAMALANGIKL